MDLQQLEREAIRLVVDGDDEAAIALIEENMAAVEAVANTEPRPFIYEELAGCYSRLGRHDEALAAMDKSIATGLRGSPHGRALKAGLLLRAARSEEAHYLFLRAKNDTPDDIWLYNVAAHEYQDAGDLERALEWSTRGLELCLATDDPERVLSRLFDIRINCLRELELEPDDLDERLLEYTKGRIDRLGQPSSEFSSQQLGDDIAIAMAWFPREDYERALELWPSLKDDWESVPHEDYCLAIQREILSFREAGTPLRWVSPIRIDEYVQWCDQKNEDPEAATARAAYAADLARVGIAIAWPPGRNSPCWCGSSKKYKRCCGSLRRT